MRSVDFVAHGDKRVTALHPTTIEVTKEAIRSSVADCIVATRSNIGASELPEGMKEEARNESAEITLTIEAGGISEKITGRGHPALAFSSKTEMVIRKSRFVCGRTLMIAADKASKDLDKRLVARLKDPDTVARIRISVRRV